MDRMSEEQKLHSNFVECRQKRKTNNWKGHLPIGQIAGTAWLTPYAGETDSSLYHIQNRSRNG